MKKLNATEDIIKHLVYTSDKQRFNLSEVNGIWMIGANQGHSRCIGEKINNDELMELIVEPFELCVHGTYSNVT